MGTFLTEYRVQNEYSMARTRSSFHEFAYRIVLELNMEKQNDGDDQRPKVHGLTLCLTLYNSNSNRRGLLAIIYLYLISCDVTLYLLVQLKYRANKLTVSVRRVNLRLPTTSHILIIQWSFTYLGANSKLLSYRVPCSTVECRKTVGLTFQARKITTGEGSESKTGEADSELCGGVELDVGEEGAVTSLAVSIHEKRVFAMMLVLLLHATRKSGVEKPCQAQGPCFSDHKEHEQQLRSVDVDPLT